MSEFHNYSDMTQASIDQSKLRELRELNAELLAVLRTIRRECTFSMDVPMPLVYAISAANAVIAKAEKLK